MNTSASDTRIGFESDALSADDSQTMAGEAMAAEDPSQSAAREAGYGGNSEAHLLDLLILVARRKRFVGLSTLAAAVLGIVFSLLLPNRYTATVNILPPQQSQSLAASMIGQLGALGPMAAMAQKDLGLKNPNDIYVGMLRSRTVEDALIRRFDLMHVYRDRKMSAAREDLGQASTIVAGKEGFVSISVEDKDPRRAPQIANAYVDELRGLTQSLAVTEAGQRRIFFEGQLKLAKNNLADAEEALKQTEQRTGLIQLDSQARAIIDSVARLRGAIATKEIELNSRRLFSTEENPDVLLAERQLSGMRTQLALLEKKAGGADDVAGADEVPPGSVPAGNVPEAGLRYVRKLRDVRYAETIFELLAKQFEAAKIDEARTAAVIQVLDPAIEPDRKSSPKRSLIVLGAMGVGFLGAVGYVVAAAAFATMRLNPRLTSRFAALNRLMRWSANSSSRIL